MAQFSMLLCLPDLEIAPEKPPGLEWELPRAPNRSDMGSKNIL